MPGTGRIKEITGELMAAQIRKWLPDSLSHSPLPEFFVGAIQLLFGASPSIAISIAVVTIVKGVLAAFGVGADTVTEEDLRLWRSGIQKTCGFLVSDYFNGREGYYYPDGLGRRTSAHQVEFLTPSSSRSIYTLSEEYAVGWLIASWCSHYSPLSNRGEAKLAIFFEQLATAHPAYGKRVLTDLISDASIWSDLQDSLAALRTQAETGNISKSDYNAVLRETRKLVLLPPSFTVESLTRPAERGDRFDSWLVPAPFPVDPNGSRSAFGECVLLVDSAPPPTGVAFKIASVGPNGEDWSRCRIEFALDPGDTSGTGDLLGCTDSAGNPIDCPDSATQATIDRQSQTRKEESSFMVGPSSTVWKNGSGVSIDSVSLKPGADYLFRFTLPEEYDPTTWSDPIALNSLTAYIVKAQILADGHTLLAQVRLKTLPTTGRATSLRGVDSAAVILISILAVAVLGGLGFVGYEATSILDRVERIFNNPIVWVIVLVVAIVTLRFLWKSGGSK